MGRRPNHPEHGASIRPTASELLSPLVRSALETVVVVNQRLAATGVDLELELARADPQASPIKVLLPRIAAQVAPSGSRSRPHRGSLDGRLGSDLATAYASLGTSPTGPARERPEPRGHSRPARLGDPDQEARALTARAKALLASRLESAKPAPTASTTLRPPARTPLVVPSPTPTASATPSSAEGGLVVNGGFEAGLSPWVLQVVSPAAATLDQDSTGPERGGRARVQIAAGADARSGISLVQSGVPLRAGQSYAVRLLVRAAEGRDVRIRLAGTNGDAYVARIFPVGTMWTTITFTFDALVDDPAAEIGIDLGRSGATTWIDAVALTSGGYRHRRANGGPAPRDMPRNLRREALRAPVVAR